VSTEETILRWRLDPVAFVEEVFGPGYQAETHEPLVIDKWQRRGLGYLVQHEPHGDCDGSPAKRIGARAAKGPGKSAWEAWVTWWFEATRPYPNIAVMSITEDNLRDNLWKELAVWYGRAPILRKSFELKGERIVPRGANSETEKRWFVSARSFPQKPNKEQQAASVAGLHSDHVMVGIDEGGDVPPGVLSAAEGIFANKSDALLLIAGNCTSVDGALYDATVKRGHRYHVIRVTGDPEDPERSPRMDLEYCRQLIADYGREDPVVMINVLGEFPSTGIDKLLSPEDVTIAERRVADRRLMQQEPNIYGLDVARHGLDLSAMTRRQGPVAFQPWVKRIDDLMILADHVAHQLTLADPKPDALIVGATGMGWGVVDRLKQLGWGHLLISIDEGKPARSGEFADIRTEMWCNLAGWVKARGCLPDSPELRADLLAPGKRQRFLRGATREIMDPSEFIRQILGRSPDRGTSLALTFAAAVAPKGLHDATYAPRMAKTDFDPFKHLRGN
jgi:hypothetical protein